jgi:DNA-binding winged helix-turn-helix (wHTH) protein
MAQDHDSYLFSFGQFVLDTRQLTLTRVQNGETIAVRVSAAEARLLHYFLTHVGILQNKETLLQTGWAGRPVSASSLPVAIANLRRYLDTPEQEAVIRTLPRQGYLFMLAPGADAPRHAEQPAPLTQTEEDAPATSATTEQATPVLGAPCQEPKPIPLSTWQQNLILTMMGGFLFLLLLTGIYLSTSWVTVTCEPAGAGTLCRTQKAAIQLPTPQKGEIWLMAGEVQTKFQEKHQ